MRRIVFNGVTVLLLSLVAQTLLGNLEQELKPVIVETFRDDQRSGALIVRTANEEYFYSHGERDVTNKLPITEDTIFFIASAAKHITAAAILRLVDKKLLSLDTPVADLIPEFTHCYWRRDAKDITVRHLLNHTSGIYDAYAASSISDRLFEETLEFQDFLSAAQCKPLKFLPGSRFEYSNTGYILLGEIVRRVGGEPFAQFVEREFFRPLGLVDSSVGRPTGPKPIALSYLTDRLGRKRDYLTANGIRVRHDNEPFTDGNIYTNIRDLSSWVEKLAAGEILSKSSTKKMFTSYRGNYGFGWNLDHMFGQTVASHAGEWIGYKSTIIHVASKKTTVIVFLNHGQIDGVAEKLLAQTLKGLE